MKPLSLHSTLDLLLYSTFVCAFDSHSLFRDTTDPCPGPLNNLCVDCKNTAACSNTPPGSVGTPTLIPTGQVCESGGNIVSAQAHVESSSRPEEACSCVAVADFVKYPDFYDNTKFFTCISSEPQMNVCPPGQIYGSSVEICVAALICTSGDFQAAKVSCTQFQYCLNGEIIIDECDTGFIFNDKINQCTNPDGSPNFSPACNSNSIYTIENPADCKTYYLCNYGVAQLKYCPEGEKFNPSANICQAGIGTTCDWEGCSCCPASPTTGPSPTSSPSPTSGPSPTSSPTGVTPPTPSSCEYNGERFPYSNACSIQFYECYFDVSAYTILTRSCPAGNYYHPNLEYCDPSCVNIP